MADESTIKLTDGRYAELMEAQRINRAHRAAALEEARLWCQVHKGTATLAEGLRSCTPAELRDLPRRCAGVGWMELTQWAEELCRRLEARQAQKDKAQAALGKMERITPAWEEGDHGHTAP